jgi:hypothetical protein
MLIYERKCIFNRYGEIIASLTFAKDIAWTKIFQRDLFTLYSNGYKTDKDGMIKFREQYVKDVLKLCGPSIIDDIVYIKGELDSLIFELAEEFTTKVNKEESDMISKEAESGTNEIESAGRITSAIIPTE